MDLLPHPDRLRFYFRVSTAYRTASCPLRRIHFRRCTPSRRSTVVLGQVTPAPCRVVLNLLWGDRTRLRASEQSGPVTLSGAQRRALPGKVFRPEGPAPQGAGEWRAKREHGRTEFERAFHSYSA
ncbi:hypothetical protein ABH922_001790 [Rhodococcus sp. 27YEA15]